MNRQTVDALARHPGTLLVFLSEALEQACQLVAAGASDKFIEATLANVETIQRMFKEDTLRFSPPYLTYCIAILRADEARVMRELASFPAAGRG